MDLTVCICTHDRPRYVRDCLKGCASDRPAGPLRDAAGGQRLPADRGRTGGAGKGARCAADPRGAARRQPGPQRRRLGGADAATSPISTMTRSPPSDWVESILDAIARPGRPPALIGGQDPAEMGSAAAALVAARRCAACCRSSSTRARASIAPPRCPKGWSPTPPTWSCNVLSLLAAGGFGASHRTLWPCAAVGRGGPARLDPAGCRAIRSAMTSRIVVHHQIQARRLRPGWLL